MPSPKKGKRAKAAASTAAVASTASASASAAAAAAASTAAASASAPAAAAPSNPSIPRTSSLLPTLTPGHSLRLAPPPARPPWAAFQAGHPPGSAGAGGPATTPSSLLARLGAFLPALAAANDALAARIAADGPASVAVEGVGEGEAHIAMDVLLVAGEPDAALLDEGSSSSGSGEAEAAPPVRKPKTLIQEMG